MAVLIMTSFGDPKMWARMVEEAVPGAETRIWPEAGAVEDIEAALVLGPEPGALARLPNLKLIQSIAMGVDHLFRDPDLPGDVPIARIVDPDLVDRMSQYVAVTVLHYHRSLDQYDRQNREGVWKANRPVVARDRRIGIIGLGAIGRDAARHLVAFGFPVAGWSRTPKSVEGLESFHGPDGLAPFLARTDIAVCLLPLTPATDRIIDAAFLAGLPDGAYMINAARGQHVVDDDLIAALDSGRLAGATLDVFREEPLPAGHPFWDHPKVRVTPHVAGHPNPRNVAAELAENLRRIEAGKAPLHPVDVERGY